MQRRESQHAIDEFEADAAQHALSEPTLVGIDIKLEETVEHDKRQEYQAQRYQHPHTGKLQALEHFDMPDQRQVESDMHEGLRIAGMFEALALNRPVDDLLWQIERQEVRDHRGRDNQQYPDLLQPGVRPNITR